MSTPYTPPGGFPPQPPPQRPESFWRQYRVLILVLATVLGFGLASVGTAYGLANSSPAAVTAPVALGDGASSSAAPSTAPAPAKVTPKPAKKKATPAPGSVTHNGPTYNGPVTIINSAPQPGSTVYVPVPSSAPYYVATNQAVVQQYYSYINAKDFSSAWNMGGSNLNGGVGYDAWVAGYSTTSWVDLSTWDYYPGYNAVGVTLTATQTDGEVKVYSGSYTVYNGSITSGNMALVSGGTSSSSVAPAGLRYVSDGVYASSSTSDAFALAVHQAYVDGGYWNQSGTSQFYATSPVTGKTYLMTSSSAGNPVVVTGGTNVIVEFNM